MSRIITLDPHLVNQIAAGEVVERPVSVVKELVENSLDAGAKHIILSIVNGGIEEISITDDGGGLSLGDLELIGKKHSTSKIKTLDDLYSVMSFGFRGEALSSISSVSHFAMTSRTQSTSTGHTLTITGGDKSSPTQTPANVGTKIIVKDLFFNVPARLNYLKSANTEKAHIADYFSAMSLAYPEVSFEFLADEKKVFLYRSEPLEQRLYNVFGEEFASHALPLMLETQGIILSGYITHPRTHYKNRDRQVLFVNKRLVKSPSIAKAIYDAYNRYIPHGTYPGYVINIDIDPTQVDVNVHPRKQEVRFAREQEIFRSVYKSIESTLDSVSLITPQTSENAFIDPATSAGGQQKKFYTGSGTKFKSYSPYKDTSPNPKQNVLDALNFSQALLSATESSGDIHDTPVGRIVGQVFNSYIVVESGKKLILFDQHALAERVIFERLCRESSASTPQKLLVSETLELTPKEHAIFVENKGVLEEIGFEAEVYSGYTIGINSVPDFVKKQNAKEIISSIIADIGEMKSSNMKSLDEVKNKVRAYTACRSAVKFGDKLSIFEISHLLKEAVLDYSATCPHGRPVAFEIDIDDLKGRFDR